MKVLLDACVPQPLWRYLPDHEVEHVNRLGWNEAKNGTLLALAEPRFDLFITSDQNLGYQQNLTIRRLAILVLWTNDWAALRERAGEITEAVERIQPGGFVKLG